MSVRGDPTAAFPPPADLLDAVDDLDLWDAKRDRLAHVAQAARDGQLDATLLRSLGPAEALDRLQQLPGIGPFSAELVLLRGAGHPDHVPRHERRLLEAVGQLYDIDEPSVDDLRELAERWRPYRTWCAVLIRAWLEYQARDGRLPGRP